MASLELILRLCSRRCQVLLHKRRQVLEVPLPTVLLSLRTSCQQTSVITTTTDLFPILVDVEGGEPVDTLGVAQLLVLVAVRSAVHLGDRHALYVGVLVGQLGPDGRQALAVAAPGGKELDKGDAAPDLALEAVLVEEP